MRWIESFLTLTILLICLALGKAATGEPPSRADVAPTSTACEVIHVASLRADFSLPPAPFVDLSAHFDSLIQAPSFLAETPSVGLSAPFDNLVPALPFQIDTSPIAAAPQRQCPTGWPAMSARRITWLQRFLF
jgi:hypothetical protein